MGGLYEFQEEDALRFARDQGIKARRHGNELWFDECPYCHKQGKQKFSIDLRSGKYHCFHGSCEASGNMITLAKDFGFSLGRNVDAYYLPKRHYRRFKITSEEQFKPKGPEISYLELRGISEDTCRRYCINWSEKYKCVVFPFRDEKGEVQTIKYRNPNPREGQSKEFAEINCKPILFGMWQCNTQNKTLVLTEGQIDSLSVSEAGIENAVSVPTGKSGFTWLPECWDWLQQWERIIVFGDNENGAITLYPEIRHHFPDKAYRVREEDYRGCKDANEILQKYGPEQIRECVENAEMAQAAQVIDIADVEDIDPTDMELLPTGIFELDDVLRGGLPFGGVTVITGKSGDGKSTFASQLLLNAINEGYRVLAYSGELPNHMFKTWLVMQAAGGRHTYEVQRKWADAKNKVYKTEQAAVFQISEWLRGKCWLIDTNQTVSEEEEQQRLVDIVEASIVRNNTRVILLDNLMTAMALEAFAGNSSKYDQQGDFVNKLAGIARKHNALILLVAHKRKNAITTETNDTISGSADIVNLATVVLSYERAQGEEGADRLVKVTKSRLFGELARDGIGLWYDETSKRVYHSNGELHRRYGWEIEEEVEYFQIDGDGDGDGD